MSGASNMFQRVQDVFEEVCDLRGDDRSLALQAACNGNETVQREVEALLAAHDGAGEFLQNPTVEHNHTDSQSIPPSEARIGEGPGTVIDRYKLLQQIGEGGFGVVFMAQQQEPVKRKIALKIIKLGMDTKQVIARFEAERQALAMMDHPNIAAVLDGGATETGRPYFVMELVRGDPLTEYCDRERLSTRERLVLFQQVCEAIQHAHQKGIIHRDLKPSNVLVTVANNTPLVKVIDFGIAKATNSELTERTLFTEFRQLIGTPEYMSPEQSDRSATDIDTRSDIYSLGVLLYELLTGTTPVDKIRLRSAAWNEIEDIIRDEDPPVPSTRVSSMGKRLTTVAKHRSVDARRLCSTLRGELDWIVMKALDKDRNRRYQTAISLSNDIDRFIKDQPVEAGPPTAGYRIAKFIKRFRAPITAAALVFGALLAGLASTTATTIWALSEQQKFKEAHEDAIAAAAEAREAHREADDQAQRAAQQAKRARRFASMAGTPMMKIDELQAFRESWLEELGRLKNVLPEEHPELVRLKCEYATWLFYAGRNASVKPLREEAALLVPTLRPVARRVLGVEDSAYQSILLAHAQEFGNSLNERRFDQITVEECERVAPIYEDLTMGFRNAFEHNLPLIFGFDLEHAVVVAKLGQYQRGAKLARNYVDWRLAGNVESNPGRALINQSRLEAVHAVFSSVKGGEYRVFMRDVNQVLQTMYATSVTEQTFMRLFELYQTTTRQLPGLQPGEFLHTLKDLGTSTVKRRSSEQPSD